MKHSPSLCLVAAILSVALVIPAHAADGLGATADGLGATADGLGATGADRYERYPLRLSAMPAAVELEDAMRDLAQKPLVEWQGSDRTRLWTLESTARSQFAHVRRSEALSWKIPGLGHYVNASVGPAIAFALTDLLIGVGGVVLIATLMPPQLRPRNVDYLHRSFAEIELIWKAVTPGELIPATATAMAVAALQLTVRALAGRDAAITAYDALVSGRVTVEPWVHPTGRFAE